MNLLRSKLPKSECMCVIYRCKFIIIQEIEQSRKKLWVNERKEVTYADHNGLWNVAAEYWDRILIHREDGLMIVAIHFY